MRRTCKGSTLAGPQPDRVDDSMRCRLEKEGKLLKELFCGAYGSATFAVLCPKCQQFSRAAIRLHFPHGFRDGLLKRLRSAIRVETMGFSKLALTLYICLCILYAYAFGLPKDLVGFQAVASALPMASLRALLFFLWMLVPALVLCCIPGWLAIRRARTELYGALSEEEALLFIKLEYLRSGKSLLLRHLFPRGAITPTRKIKKALSRLSADGIALDVFNPFVQFERLEIHGASDRVLHDGQKSGTAARRFLQCLEEFCVGRGILRGF